MEPEVRLDDGRTPGTAHAPDAALLYLKHTFALSDEDVVERWCENPYWQHFSGERYFRHDLPCDPSSLVRWRQRIGEEGCEWLLAQSIEAAKNAGLMKRRSLDGVRRHRRADTQVQQLGRGQHGAVRL